MYRHRPPTNPFLIGLFAVFGLGTLIALIPLLAPRHSITIEGVAAGQTFAPQGLATKVVSVVLSPANAASTARIRLDERIIQSTAAPDGKLNFVLGDGLPDGSHNLIVESGSRMLWRGAPQQRVNFTVDSIAPTLTATVTGRPTSLEDDITIIGTTEPGSTLNLNGQPIVVAKDGGFTTTLKRAPIGAFRFTSIDLAGNETKKMLPGLSESLFPKTRAVHVSFAAWTYEPLRRGVLALIDEGKIDTVEFDLKDEDGFIGHRSAVPMANQIGATKDMYDLKTEVAILKAKGVRVMGRLVVFRDPVLSKAAWQGKQFDQVLQNADGTPFAGKYGGFTNPFDRTVRNYNMAIALEAAQAGVDSIVLDYIRRPEAKLEDLKFAGVEGAITGDRVSEEVAGYVAEIGMMLNDTPTRLGVSVFGVAVKKDEQNNIGQNVPMLAAVSDFIAPMVYPSAWGSGQFGVADPPAQPYDIVLASLKAFQVAIEGTGARLTPWLQDFNLIKKYGPKEVRAQIVAAADTCIPDWLMWDPKVTYSSDGYPTNALSPSDPNECVAP